MDRAACKNWAGKVFLWEQGSRKDSDALIKQKLRMAKNVCRDCPVRRECLEFALTSEQAGSTSIGRAEFAWRERDARGNFSGGYRYVWRPFTVSTTPAYGIWGGLTATERHRKDIKHEQLVANVCVRGWKCPGCRPVSEWADRLLEEAS